MIFLRTEDLILITSIVCHPSIYDSVADDNAPAREACVPTISPTLLYLLCYDTDPDDLLGMWLFVPLTSTTWDTHTYLLPGHGYRRGRQAAKECMEYLWKNTQVQRIVTSVPVFNRAAILFARASGMKEYGRNPQAYLKRGVHHDMVMLGVTRPEVD